jgi:hypothetical protein
MAKHKVTPNQNIWDVAMLLYGTIEGVFDLLISNPQLNMTTDLVPGMELEYHDYFVINEGIVSGLKSESLVPANGQRHVYYKSTDQPLIFVCGVPNDKESIDFTVSGDGVMVIDWGDNTELESIELSHTSRRLLHYFDNVVDVRRVRIYGTFNLLSLDTSLLRGDMYTIRPVVVDEFVSKANGNSLKGLLLFDGTVKVDLRKMAISDLSPIYNMSLQELNLLQVQFSDVSVLDNYLVNIVENYGSRRDCTVYLDTEPTEVGMAAIQTIINEPAWNESGKWKFVINDIVYTKES